MTNAQVALEAASRIHQKVAAGTGAAVASSAYANRDGHVKVDKATDDMVLSTATKFLEWLNNNTAEDNYPPGL